MLGHKTNLNKFKKTEIIPNIFSDPNGIKIEINYNKKYGKKHKNMEIKLHATEKTISKKSNK